MRVVADIMNSKLLYIAKGTRAALARARIIEFGITALPVLDEAHRPAGMISLRDLVNNDGGVVDVEADTFEPRDLGVVATIRNDVPIEEAAQKLVDGDHHHLVVVDDNGIAVGMVSSLDFVRALVGLPSHHPESFARF